MKFSTSFTLATLALLSIGTNSSTATSGHRKLHSQKNGKKCQDPTKYNKTYTPQCLELGKGFACKNARLGGTHPDFRCVGPPTPPPAKAKQCHTDHNPTYTPECPSGTTCKAILGGGKKNAGQCIKVSNRRDLGGSNKSSWSSVKTVPAAEPVSISVPDPVGPVFCRTNTKTFDADCTKLLGKDYWCRAILGEDAYAQNAGVCSPKVKGEMYYSGDTAPTPMPTPAPVPFTPMDGGMFYSDDTLKLNDGGMIYKDATTVPSRLPTPVPVPAKPIN